MVYYEPVKVLIDILALAEVIINTIVRYYGLPDFNIRNQGLVFISKF